MVHRARAGFSLVELLVAITVFATMAALAYGGLNSIARTRTELGRQEDQFRDLMRAVETLKRDLVECVARPVRGANGQALPAILGAANHIELTRVGFANPQAEQRSNLERVLYEIDSNTLKRGRYAVLDRAQDSQPAMSDMHVKADDFRLRYLTRDGQWLEVWPPPQATDAAQLPIAVQWNLRSTEYGELEGVVELVHGWPLTAANVLGANPGTPPPITTKP
ncbi:MAG: type II secretion system minor pseudopilin GspJ [Rudaea sp.]